MRPPWRNMPLKIHKNVPRMTSLAYFCHPWEQCFSKDVPGDSSWSSNLWECSRNVGPGNPFRYTGLKLASEQGLIKYHGQYYLRNLFTVVFSPSLRVKVEQCIYSRSRSGILWNWEHWWVHLSTAQGWRETWAPFVVAQQLVKRNHLPSLCLYVSLSLLLNSLGLWFL